MCSVFLLGIVRDEIVTGEPGGGRNAGTQAYPTQQMSNFPADSDQYTGSANVPRYVDNPVAYDYGQDQYGYDDSSRSNY